MGPAIECIQLPSSTILRASIQHHPTCFHAAPSYVLPCSTILRASIQHHPTCFHPAPSYVLPCSTILRASMQHHPTCFHPAPSFVLPSSTILRASIQHHPSCFHPATSYVLPSSTIHASMPVPCVTSPSPFPPPPPMYSESPVQGSKHIHYLCPPPEAALPHGRPAPPLPGLLVQKVLPSQQMPLSACSTAAMVMSPSPSPFPEHSYPTDHFKALVEKINLFISVRLFPPHPADLPPPPKCAWWIPSAIKVLAVLSEWRKWPRVNFLLTPLPSFPPPPPPSASSPPLPPLPYTADAANNLALPPLIPYTDFYNEALDHTDLMTEYYAWQSPQGFVTM